MNNGALQNYKSLAHRSKVEKQQGEQRRLRIQLEKSAQQANIIARMKNNFTVPLSDVSLVPLPNQNVETGNDIGAVRTNTAARLASIMPRTQISIFMDMLGDDIFLFDSLWGAFSRELGGSKRLSSDILMKLWSKFKDKIGLGTRPIPPPSAPIAGPRVPVGASSLGSSFTPSPPALAPTFVPTFAPPSVPSPLVPSVPSGFSLGAPKVPSPLAPSVPSAPSGFSMVSPSIPPSLSSEPAGLSYLDSLLKKFKAAAEYPVDPDLEAAAEYRIKPDDLELGLVDDVYSRRKGELDYSPLGKKDEFVFSPPRESESTERVQRLIKEATRMVFEDTKIPEDEQLKFIRSPVVAPAFIEELAKIKLENVTPRILADKIMKYMDASGLFPVPGRGMRSRASLVAGIIRAGNDNPRLLRRRR